MTGFGEILGWFFIFFFCLGALAGVAIFVLLLGKSQPPTDDAG
jgi:hypothetical protein